MAHKKFSPGRPAWGNGILSLHIWVDQICEIQLWCIFVRVFIILYIFRSVYYYNFKKQTYFFGEIK